jgi:hypothetical protein
VDTAKTAIVDSMGVKSMGLEAALKRGAEVDRGTIADAVVLAGAHGLAPGSPGDAVLRGPLRVYILNQKRTRIAPSQIFLFTPAIEAQAIQQT